jgi:DNA-binding SARP family transcriptional activator
VTEPAAVRFQVLGPLVVWSGERTLAPGSEVRRALLGLLLLADGQPLPPERLLRAIWGDEPPASGRGAVHVGVSRLRSWLDRDLGGVVELDHEAGGYRLRVPAVSLDLTAFRALLTAGARAGSAQGRIRHLHGALHLWRGPVVADGTAWVRADVLVRQVERLRVEAACSLADAAVTAGQPERALCCLEATAAAYPLDERVQAALAVTLAAGGRQAEGLEVVQRARARLVDGLGLDPGPHLQYAQLRILRQQLGQVSQAHAPPADMARFPPPGRDG